MQPGQMIAGKYRLNALLGTGGMASVWSATNMFTEKQLAVKFLLPTFARTPEAAKRFLMEAKVSGRVQHPNIIEILDVGQAEDGSLFLVMELLTGQSLEMAMRKQQPPMTVYDFIGIMLDVARALAAAHRGGVIHRDLKPSNVVLHTDRGGVAVPKVLDFGVSKFLLEDQHDNGLTMAGTVLGSPLYMSPEQASGVGDIDHRTDIFAFGAILFEGLCGFRCFDAPNFNALIVTVATQQPKNIDSYAGQMPASLRAVVRDCLLTDRAARIGSFDQVIERLTAILPELQQSPLRLPPPVRPEPPSDPEATSAMPAIVRPSDRPPSMPGAMPLTGLEQGGSAAPWAGSLPGYRPRGKPHVLLFAVGGAVLASMVIVLGLGIVLARKLRHAAPPSAATAVAVTSRPALETPPAPSASSSGDVPVVSVDALPVATSGHARIGRLVIEASPHSCVVTIDGRPHGPTPITGLDLPAGAHSVRCETYSGVAKIVTVTVADGQTTRHHFVTSP
ncbi:MAG TPA: serine/threonine-protein kinase [Polyangiaceae bacterium]|nr:serine/threonine-protein kinase [Polyangiaceae bacterium]